MCEEGTKVRFGAVRCEGRKQGRNEGRNMGRTAGRRETEQYGWDGMGWDGMGWVGTLRNSELAGGRAKAAHTRSEMQTTYPTPMNGKGERVKKGGQTDRQADTKPTNQASK